VDYYFLRSMGFFISAKLDGLCGFLSFSNGAYYVSLRDGTQFLVTDPNARPVNLGRIDETINIEIFFNSVTKLFQLWYVAACPKKYPSEPLGRKKYFKEIFRPWSIVVEVAKQEHAGLFFKNYCWIPPHNERSGNFNLSAGLDNSLNIPYDGVVFHDPYGAFTAFWKPWRTADVMIDETSQGLCTYRGAQRFSVEDPRCRFIRPGIYEVMAIDGEIRIIHSRIEKQNAGLAPVHHVNDLFQLVDGFINISGLTIPVKFRDIYGYLESYGNNYTQIMTNLATLNLGVDDIKIIYAQVLYQLKSGPYHVRDGKYLISDFVNAMSVKSTHNPTRLWLSFISVGLMRGPGPYQPEICNFGGWKGVINVNDLKEADTIVLRPGKIVLFSQFTGINTNIKLVLEAYDGRASTNDILVAFKQHREYEQMNKRLIGTYLKDCPLVKKDVTGPTVYWQLI